MWIHKGAKVCENKREQGRVYGYKAAGTKRAGGRSGFEKKRLGMRCRGGHKMAGGGACAETCWVSADKCIRIQTSMNKRLGLDRRARKEPVWIQRRDAPRDQRFTTVWEVVLEGGGPVWPSQARNIWCPYENTVNTIYSYNQRQQNTYSSTIRNLLNGALCANHPDLYSNRASNPLRRWIPEVGFPFQKYLLRRHPIHQPRRPGGAPFPII